MNENQTVLILGAKGRLGRAATEAFREAGWRVRAGARAWEATPPGVEAVVVDAFDPGQTIGAAEGCDVIVNALNPPYPQWERDLPRFTASVLAAARASGATVIVPGNVYNYGESMPELLSEATPAEPSTRKGRLRVELEDAYRAATAEGVRTLVLRAGDFIDLRDTGNWFESHITNAIGKDVVTYPGPLDRVHAWAYLPDLARAIVGLAEQRATLAPFETVGFEGYSLTGAELVAALERRVGRTLKVKRMPWPILRVLAWFNPMIREVYEMRYLWNVPHRIDGARLAALLSSFESTPLEQVLARFVVPGEATEVPPDAKALRAR